MGKHEIALHYSKEAVKVLQPEYEKRYSTNTMGDNDEKMKFASIVSTAIHNAAVEYEYCNDYS